MHANLARATMYRILWSAMNYDLVQLVLTCIFCRRLLPQQLAAKAAGCEHVDAFSHGFVQSAPAASQ